ncbi:helix-turn-helix protein [Roseiarcus fermentans]|uniref:Helix-turn-helix protein n=1 Tax=Roseiarcus fermentans TaxID=1473586 RepID=A0A366F4J9_9HYPH|nr:XRE family transcriptional regulator [Roseiarcus fermentans]RBP08635.1 helix-turn-helix protein [Roseiarcus fermentans]
MSRSLDDVLASLPEERRQRVEARAQELMDEVESLGKLRRVAGKAQVDIASALKVKQPSVSKIEKQTDMYLSTLRSYIEAVGGQLELVVRLPSHAPLRLQRLGDLALDGAASRTRKITAKRRAKPKAPPG